MNLYPTNSFRYLATETIQKLDLPHKEKKALQQNFSESVKLVKIIERNFLKEIYMSYKSEFFLSEADALALVAIIHTQFGIMVEPVALTEEIEVIRIADFVDFKDMINKARIVMFAPEAKAKKEEAKIPEKSIIDGFHTFRKPMPKNIKNLRILSMDFEYDQNKDFQISECGMSTYFNGDIVHEHYIVAGNYENKKHYNLQFKFKFGESQIITMASLLKIIQSRISKADYIVGHGVAAEYLVLKHYGFKLAEMSNIAGLDTQKIFASKFHYETEHKHLSLGDMLSLLAIPYESLHNAGNDAAYALHALIKMVDCFVKYKKKGLRKIPVTSIIA
jgi:hypothetical protein